MSLNETPLNLLVALIENSNDPVRLKIDVTPKGHQLFLERKVGRGDKARWEAITTGVSGIIGGAGFNTLDECARYLIEELAATKLNSNRYERQSTRNERRSKRT